MTKEHSIIIIIDTFSTRTKITW